MGLSKEILLTIKDYEINLDQEIKFYEYDTINLCFSIMEYGIIVKDGVSVNKLMPIQALKAYILIETPDKTDYAEATMVENNRVVFNLGNRYSRFIGVGRMQIVIKDSDGCRITLPEFPFEIRESINSDWDDELSVFTTEKNDIIIVDGIGRPIETTKISELDEAEELSQNSYTMIVDEDGNKKTKISTITKDVNDRLDNVVSDVNELLETKADISSIPTKVSQLTNDSGYLTTHQDISGKVDKIEGKGLSTNDYTTEEKNKLSGLSNYTHPTSHSATMIVQDETHRFVTDSEKSTWNNKLNLTLGTSSTTAYRGDYGNIAYTHSQSTHAPSNAQKNSDITKSEIESKLTGDIGSHSHSQYAKQSDLVDMSSYKTLTLGVHTDGFIYLFKDGQPMGGGISQTVIMGDTDTNPDLDADVVGYVDSDKTIVLNGTLGSGVYTLCYELENGEIITIGELNLTSSNTSYINLAKPYDADWHDNKRWSKSANSPVDQEGFYVTNVIEARKGDVLRVKGIDLYNVTGSEKGLIVGFTDDGTLCSYAVTAFTKSESKDGVKEAVTKDGDIFTYTLFHDSNGQQSGNTECSSIRISAPLLNGYDKSGVIITVNEEIPIS